MEFWRTDEIAPVVLIILLELMLLGLINYTMELSLNLGDGRDQAAAA